MADKTINDLPQAVSIAINDLFVLQQGNTAKKCTGALFLQMVEAHGGIASVSLGADYKLTFVFADGTSWTSAVSIRGPQGEQGETGEKGNTGEKGDTGDTGNGIASTVLNADYTLTINFTDGTSYTTPSIRGAQGETGATGDEAEILSTEYGTSASSSTQPTSWQSVIPTVIGGNFLWTRYTWNNGTYTYQCTRYGVDGTGTGDMTTTVYDPDNEVAEAGGIVEYGDANYDSIGSASAVQGNLNTHTGDSTIHVTSSDKSTWNGKADKPDMGTVSLSASWNGSVSPYTQTVSVNGATVTSNSKVDIQPSASVIAQLITDGCNGLYIENNNGTLTAYAVGEKPTVALSNIQVSVTEVVA